MDNQGQFCFCTLALSHRYQLMAKDLAKDLAKYGSEKLIVVGTDDPNFFEDCNNVLAFELHQQGIFNCYNDKRFVIKKSLERFDSAIFIDADTRIVKPLPDNLAFSPGITGTYRNLREHLNKYHSKDIDLIKKLADKLNISLPDVDWIGDSLFVVTKDGEKEKEFFKMWELIASYLEMKGMHSGQGRVMGLAATKVGWKVKKTESWKKLHQIKKHIDASDNKPKKTWWDHFQRQLGYHYRLNKARLTALKDFTFYYR